MFVVHTGSLQTFRRSASGVHNQCCPIKVTTTHGPDLSANASVQEKHWSMLELIRHYLHKDLTVMPFYRVAGVWERKHVLFCPSLLLSESPTAHRCEAQSHIVNTWPLWHSRAAEQRRGGELVTGPSWTSPLSLRKLNEQGMENTSFTPPYHESRAQLFQTLKSLWH